jgi:pimeloyl-ACP methyl ester carboxylesterase
MLAGQPRIVREASRKAPLDSPPVSRPLPHVDGVEHRFVHAGGLRTHVAEAGKGEPIVMLHGWPQHWYEWRKLIGPLGERYRVICPDLRGLGWTDAPPNGYEKERLADDVLAVLDALELGRVRLVGHDWGGWVGYLLCLRAPERFERCVALNILPPFVRAELRSVLNLWRLWYQWAIAAPVIGERGVRALATNPVLRWIGRNPGTWTDEERDEFLGQFREPERARASVQYYRTFQLKELPRLPLLYRDAYLRVPTRILFGTGDRVQRPSALKGIERRGEDLAYELFPGVGHFIADERPDLVLDRTLSFFGERK